MNSLNFLSQLNLRISDKLKLGLAISNTIILWSSALVEIRVGLTSFSPGSLAVMRFTIASLFMGCIYLMIPNRSRIALRDIPRLMIMGFSGIGVYNIALNFGEVAVPAGVAGFIIGLIPVFTMILTSIFLGERLPRRSYFGVAISIFGTLLIAFSDLHNISFGMGILDCLLAAMVASIFTTIQKPLTAKYNPIELTTYTVWFGTLLLLICFLPQTLRELPQASSQATFACVYLGIFPACFAYMTWAYALTRIPAGRCAAYMYSIPFVTCLIGFVVLGEIPTLLAFTGGSIALLGAFFVNHFAKK